MSETGTVQRDVQHCVDCGWLVLIKKHAAVRDRYRCNRFRDMVTGEPGECHMLRTTEAFCGKKATEFKLPTLEEMARQKDSDAADPAETPGGEFFVSKDLDTLAREQGVTGSNWKKVYGAMPDLPDPAEDRAMFESPRTVRHSSGAQHVPADPQRRCPITGKKNFADCYDIGEFEMVIFKHPHSGLPCDCKREEEKGRRCPECGSEVEASRRRGMLHLQCPGGAGCGWAAFACEVEGCAGLLARFSTPLEKIVRACNVDGSHPDFPDVATKPAAETSKCPWCHADLEVEPPSGGFQRCSSTQCGWYGKAEGAASKPSAETSQPCTATGANCTCGHSHP